MLGSIVQSAFQTGCLSVEAEALIRQVLSLRVCQANDLEALRTLYQAMKTGEIRREAPPTLQLPSIKN